MSATSAKNSAAERENTTFPDEFYRDPYGVDRYVVQEKILFNWLAPSRIKKTWKQSEITTLVITLFIVAALLLLLGEYFLLFVFVIVIGISALFATTQPVQQQCQITTIGLKVDDKYYYWQQLSQFWFELKKGVTFLYFRDVLPRATTPMVLKLIIRPEDQQTIKTTMGTYLLYKKPQQTQWQKFSVQFLARLPFDLDLW